MPQLRREPRSPTNPARRVTQEISREGSAAASISPLMTELIRRLSVAVMPRRLRHLHQLQSISVIALLTTDSTSTATNSEGASDDYAALPTRITQKECVTIRSSCPGLLGRAMRHKSRSESRHH